MKFEDKVVLIVGASSGIGRTPALRLAAEGAHVVVSARRREKLESLVAQIAQQGGHALALAPDAQDAAAAERVVHETVQRWGRIELVVLNAGGAPALDRRTMGAREVTATCAPTTKWR
jgi:NADP-dependent 3-hydroxy acid dehydrogenase YdfG